MLIELFSLTTKENSIQQVTVPLEMKYFKSRLGSFPLKPGVEVSLTLIYQGERKFLIQGEGTVILTAPCGRCLTDVEVLVPLSFEKEVSLAMSEEERIKELDENNYICDTKLDVEQLVHNEILVNWPLWVLCKDDCKGICSHCGENLNEGSCGCDRESLDPRMAVISDIFSKFKEV